MRSRIIKEKAYMDLMGCKSEKELIKELDGFADTLTTSGIYFKGFHHALRENQRLELVTKMPGCVVLGVKFYSKNLIFVSLANGLILAYNTNNRQVEKIFANKGAIIDCLKLLGPVYLVTAGIDSKIRLWNIKTEKLFAKFEIHKYST